MEVFGNGMTRGTTWEGVEDLVFTKVQIRIALVFRDGTDRQTDRQTDGHGDSMTNSAQWGRVGENAIDRRNQFQEIR